ncbi:RraA family protein [Mariniluteicoccus endophyticus]
MSRNPHAWTIDESPERVDPGVIDGLAAIETGQLADGDPRVRVMDPGIRIQAGDGELCGPAVTCWTNPGDLLFPLKSADCVSEGDVVVIDGSGHTASALVGEVWAGTIAAHGVAGAVVDGAVRDVLGVEQAGVTFYARATNPGKQTIAGPGAINVPITCGGVVVEPGDIVRADRTGVVVIPRDCAAEVLAAAHAVDEIEKGWIEALRHDGFGTALGLDALIEQGRGSEQRGG